VITHGNQLVPRLLTLDVSEATMKAAWVLGLLLLLSSDAHAWGRRHPSVVVQSRGATQRFVIRKLDAKAREAVAAPLANLHATIETWQRAPAAKAALEQSFAQAAVLLGLATPEAPVTLTIGPIRGTQGAAMSVSAPQAKHRVNLSVVPLVAFSVTRAGELLSVRYDGRVSGTKLADFFAWQPRRLNSDLRAGIASAASIRYEATGRGRGLGEGLLRLFDDKGALVATLAASRGEFMEILGATYLE
jgi:hypothetical protein